jgi:NAD(P) transhydrogenase subunit beta
MNLDVMINLSYLAAALAFAYGIKLLGSASTAVKGNMLSAGAMALSVLATFFDPAIVQFKWIIISMLLGTGLGAYAARTVEMTGMPELVALFNGFGGLASLLVSWAVFHLGVGLDFVTSFTIYCASLIGALTFTGSFIAYAKLAERMEGKPILFKGQHQVNAGLLVLTLILGVVFSRNPLDSYTTFIIIVILSLVIGITFVIPIGGADMPVVISFLNSASGLAACFAGFVVKNNVLIVSGSLVGASGMILTLIMCKGMNRTLGNVFFSGLGADVEEEGGGDQGTVKQASPQDAYYVLEAAKSLVVVPGYGLAVSQAQHIVRELGDILEENGCDVKYAIHPVAGRMPGHMNVLLAEANVSYDQLATMEDVNPNLEMVDVCMVVGANDVVNTGARDNEKSLLYGMPIIEADKARTIYIFKRSLASGFAGLQNPLFFHDKTYMIFGDAKSSLSNIVAEFKD